MRSGRATPWPLHGLLVGSTAAIAAALVAPVVRGWEPRATWITLLGTAGVAFIGLAGPYVTRLVVRGEHLDDQRREAARTFADRLQQVRETTRAKRRGEATREDATTARRLFDEARRALLLVAPDGTDLDLAARRAAQAYDSPDYDEAVRAFLAVAGIGRRRVRRRAVQRQEVP